MSETGRATVFIVDDDLIYRRVLLNFLNAGGFNVQIFKSAAELLATPQAIAGCDLILSDINMPDISGFELCAHVRANKDLGRVPVILITGADPTTEKARGFEVGADDFITKPFRNADLLAKIRSLLQIRAAEIAARDELRSVQGQNGRLQWARRFVSPNVANMMSVETAPSKLKPHRAEVSVLFVDLRRFTAFSERCESEEVLEVLSSYYTAVGAAAMKHQGTLGFLAGDGIMVFFNDPEPVPNHLDAAVNMAIEAREALLVLRDQWTARSYDIDFGIGISSGFATIGEIGFEQFSQYSVLGPVPNFAARLCSAAVEGHILISHRFLSRMVNKDLPVESLGEIRVKGFDKSVHVYNVLPAKKI